MPSIQFSFPVEDCLGCCRTPCPTSGNYILTANAVTLCPQCRVTLNPVFRYKVLDASNVLGAFMFAFDAGLTVITTVPMTEYSDVCVTVDSTPDANVSASITCFDGELTVSIRVDIPNSLDPLFVEVFQGVGAIGEVINNILDCSSGELPFFIDSVTVTLSP